MAACFPIVSLDRIFAMKQFAVWTSLALALALHSATLLAAPSVAGKLVSASGPISVTDAGNIERAMKPGDRVYAGETVKSGPSVSAKLLMADQSILDLQPGTQLVIEDFDLRSG